MELTSRHKAYLIVLGLAGVALGVDRMLLSGEASSPSKAGAASSPTSQETPKSEQSASPSNSPKATLAARMDALRAREGSADAPPSGVGNAFVPEWDLGVTPQEAVHATRADPWAWLKLTSVVPGRAAVLNGTVVFVGKEHAVPLDGGEQAAHSGAGGKPVTRKVVLVRAEERRVIVRCEGEEGELALDDHSELQRARVSSEDSGVVVTPADSGGE